ncbi:MAG TPA: universal stress protein [Burkholderiales bacterium]|jgi:nucleotide-binding universal stress UspA family protein
MKILLAVDGSKHSLAAADFLIKRAGWARDALEVELVTVHLPVPAVGRMGVGPSKANLQKYYTEEGEAMLAPAKKKLAAAKIAHQAKVLVGPIAETMVKHANAAGCDMICIGTRGMTAAANVLLGSTATKVLHLSAIPVLVVK